MHGYTDGRGITPGRTRTNTERGLSPLPLHWATPGKTKLVLPVGFAPTTRRFEAGRSDLLSYGSLVEMERATGLAPGKSGFADRRLD